MKFYFLYIITSLLTAWIILVLLGVSAGFENFIPVVALIGSLLLFAIAAPLLLYNNRVGLIIGFISLLLMLPYTIGFAKSGLEDGVFNWGVILSLLPALFALLATYLTAKYLFFQPGANLMLPESSGVRMFLAFVPIGITILYFIFYGKEWF